MVFQSDDATPTGADGDEKGETSLLEDSTVTVDDKVEVNKVKKKKKKRHSEIDSTETTTAVGDESIVVLEEDILSSTKKKHKKKHQDTDIEDVTSNANQLDIQLLRDSQPPATDESVIKKRKKSKKKPPGMHNMFQCMSGQLRVPSVYSGTIKVHSECVKQILNIYEVLYPSLIM